MAPKRRSGKSGRSGYYKVGARKRDAGDTRATGWSSETAEQIHDRQIHDRQVLDTLVYLILPLPRWCPKRHESG